jgi:uncharacterized membrane protein YkvA (DUF1232 family)
MSDTETAHVETIREWLTRYREDVRLVQAAMLSDAPSPRARYTLAGVLNYQLRKMDLAPDWTPEIGMVDDAMVLRTGAAVFKINNLLPLPSDVEQTIERLARDDEAVKAILGQEQHENLFQRVRGLVERRIHGRTPEEIVEDAAMRERFLGELDRFLEGYRPPAIGEPAAFMRSVRSYIGAKLE